MEAPIAVLLVLLGFSVLVLCTGLAIALLIAVSRKKAARISTSPSPPVSGKAQPGEGPPLQ